MQRDLQALADGAMAGLAATLPMSAVMQAAKTAGLMPEQPPERITERALRAVGVHLSERESDGASAAAHLAFGAAAGALFGVLHRRIRPPVPAAAHGVVFGLLVYGASYEGWIPSLGLLAPPAREDSGIQPAMMAAHVVYGAALGAALQRLGSARHAEDDLPAD